MKPAISFVPALPGWVVLVPIWGGSGKIEEFCREPVIAWRISAEHLRDADPADPHVMVTAVTCEGTADDDAALQRPDGSLTIPLVGDYDSEARLIAHLNEEAEKRELRRAEKARG